jgi:transposase
VLVEFHQSRGGAVANTFLGKWTGTLISDGYSGYNELCRRKAIVRAECWSHARRYFKQALDTGSRDAPSGVIWTERGYSSSVRLCVADRRGD